MSGKREDVIIRGDLVDKVDVVVIDDDAGVRWVLQELFSMADISCMHAESGHEGIQLVSKYRPPLAIVDIKLGAMNGLEVARCIYRECKQIKILFITGYSETIEGKVDEDLPVIGILEKPFNIGEVLQQVKSVLNQAKGSAERPVAFG
jgi:two-component system response regulator (stage 0 sporulation protein F)